MRTVRPTEQVGATPAGEAKLSMAGWLKVMVKAFPGPEQAK